MRENGHPCSIRPLSDKNLDISTRLRSVLTRYFCLMVNSVHPFRQILINFAAVNGDYLICITHQPDLYNLQQQL